MSSLEMQGTVLYRGINTPPHPIDEHGQNWATEDCLFGEVAAGEEFFRVGFPDRYLKVNESAGRLPRWSHKGDFHFYQDEAVWRVVEQ